ncbi:uncharacterized protein [Nicotiana sylvestris]|uniref:uncharacterized protein n=1 Tax=Nicotiana sylvestris TaxID=4096 RepID=UPI00388C9A5D
MANQELEASIVDPSKEVEESEANLKEEVHKLKQQMAEMYLAWEKGHPSPAYPANPAYIPPLAQPQEPSTPPKNPEQEEMFRKVKSLEQSFRNMQGLGGQVSVAYKDLCLFPDVQLPAGFKMPKFDLYNGHGDPVAHLRGFCSKMRGAGRKDELLMAYFSQSLSGSVLEWYTRQDHRRWYTWDDLAQAFACHFQYNLEIILDRLSLTKIEKKHNESFREYGFRLRQLDMLKPIEAKLPNPPPRNLDHSVCCKYCSGAPRHNMEKCWQLKTAIQELIDTNRIEIQAPEASNINQNPLPTHHETNMIEYKAIPWNYERVTVTYKGNEVQEEVYETHGLTRSVRCFAPKELRKAKTSKDNLVLVKKHMTEEEAEELLRKMKVQDYSIVEHLRKTPAQISLLSLLIHSDEHRRALMKILNEAYVPDKISVNHLEKIENKIFEVNRVTLSDDEFPVEGTEHNRALYLTVKCEDSVVTRNSQEQYLCSGVDGGGKDSVGDIVLELTIGPVEFTMEFQVLDVAVSYNLLLGRPWIHAAKAVPSTLHQMVKFNWDIQEIVVHCEDDLCVPSDAIVPFIEVEDDKGPWVY